MQSGLGARGSGLGARGSGLGAREGEGSCRAARSENACWTPICYLHDGAPPNLADRLNAWICEFAGAPPSGRPANRVLPSRYRRFCGCPSDDDTLTYLRGELSGETEVFDASANNVVVERIDRGTPLVVNRHPAICEYVGDDYPLLFDSIDDGPRLLADRGQILAAHHHLLAQRAPWLDARTFAAEIGRFCHEVQPAPSLGLRAP